MPSPVASRRSRRTINEINMVPFIDVMLVLLIIFMVTAPLIPPSQIDLPSIGKANQQPDRVIQVIVRSDTNITVVSTTNNQQGTTEKRTTTLNNLPTAIAAVQQGDAKTPVVIAADRTVQYEQVVKVMDSLQKSGIERVGLSVVLAQP